MPAEPCPSPERLSAYLLGTLPEEETDQLLRHVETCLECETTIQNLEDTADSLIGRVRQPALGDEFAEETECYQALARAADFGQAILLPEKTAVETADLGTLGQYELLEKLGQGGMGVVYKARHVKLDRIVALKVLSGARMVDEHAIARFEREMKAVGRLDHPNIVRATDAGEIDGTPYLVMEYVDGLDLGQLVHRLGPLPVADACELVRQAAVALQYVHDQGMVHRDVKPSNLMLTTAGQVKLMDLGLALLQDLGADAARELTDTGQTLGTADYMAPEQASDSHQVDIRADVYSLGATLYKLLCDRAPFAGREYDTPMKKMMALATKPVPPIRQLHVEIPEKLAAVVYCMLARDATKRYAVAADVAIALAPYTASRDLPALLKQAEQTDEALAQADSAHAGTDPGHSSALVGTQPGAAQMAVPPPAPVKEGPFDPYHRWLSISPEEQPPNHYRLLGIKPFETDADVIDGAADRQMAHLRTFQTGKRSEQAARVLNEVASARVCLLNPTKKAAYDAKLREKAAAPARAKPPAHTKQSPPASKQQPPVRSRTDPGLAQMLDRTSREAGAGRPGPAAKRLPPKRWIAIGTAAAALLLAFGVVLHIATDTGEVVITIDPPDAKGVRITVDGQEIEIGGPGQPIRIRAREHDLEVTGPDYETCCQSFTVRRGETTKVTATLQSKWGRFAIVLSDPALADQVKLDRKVIEKTKLNEPLRLAVGEHTLEVAGKDIQTVSKRFTVQRGDNSDLPVQLVAVSAELAPTGVDDQRTWSEPVNLGPVVNSSDKDLDPALSADGLTLLFASDRPGGEGRDDLWMSRRSSVDEPFGKPVNLGRPVNTRASDKQACLSADGLMLLFSSQGPGGEGGHDLWMSRRPRVDEAFGKPVNLGSRINTKDNEASPSVSADGLMLLFGRHKLVRNDTGGNEYCYQTWMATRASVEEPFGEPVMLGGEVTSPMPPWGPYLLPDALRMIHGGPGLSLRTRSDTNAPFGKPVRILPPGRFCGGPEMSADGQTLYFHRIRPDRQYDIDLWYSRRLAVAPLHKPVDLLNLIDVKRDAVRGQWRREGRCLISPQSVAAIVQIPYALPEEYDLTVVAERKSCDCELRIGLPVAGGLIHVVIDETSGHCCGLEKVDNEFSGHNETTRRDGPFLPIGEPHTIVCTVRKTGVRVNCDGEELIDWSGHPQRLSSSGRWPVRDNDKLFLGAWDSTFRFSKVEIAPVGTAQPPPPLPGWRGYFRKSLAFHPGGSILAGAGWAPKDSQVTLWNVSKGTIDRTLDTSTPTVRAVVFSPDGSVLAIGGAGPVTCFAMAMGKETRTLEGHTGDLLDLEFSPDGKTLAGAGNAGRVTVWDAATGKPLRTIKVDGSPITSIAFNPDGSTLASASWDRTVKLWDLATGKLLRTLNGHSREVHCVTFSPDGSTLASGSADRTVRLWDVTTAEPTRTLDVEATVYRVAFSPDGAVLASGQHSTVVKIWDANTGELREELEGHPQHAVVSVAFSPDGSLLATGGTDQAVKLWRPPELIGELSAGVAWPIDNLRREGVPADEMEVMSVDIPEKKVPEVLVAVFGEARMKHGGHINWMDFDPTGKVLATGRGDRTVKLWGLTTSIELKELAGHDEFVWATAFNPDGHFAGSLGVEKELVYVVQAEPGEQLTLTPDEFAAKYGWKNDPSKVWSKPVD